MQFTKTDIFGVQVINPDIHTDHLGRFLSAWSARQFRDQGIDFQPVEANFELSFRTGTVRGMHFESAPASGAKLVRCTRGSIFDVVIDLGPESRSYGQWYSAVLTAENARMLYVPVHCAHGYQTLQDETEVYYLSSQSQLAGSVRGVRYDDPAFSIRWPLAATELSDQDRSWPPQQGHI
jgi:dTDP-4-dehydrorhamnose 3,5-epimerase